MTRLAKRLDTFRNISSSSIQEEYAHELLTVTYDILEDIFDWTCTHENDVLSNMKHPASLSNDFLMAVNREKTRLYEAYWKAEEERKNK